MLPNLVFASLSVLVLSASHGMALDGCSHDFFPKQAQVTNRTITINDPRLGPVNRSYRLFVPGGVRAKRVPLVLGFHGQSGNPTKWAHNHSFDTLANMSQWIMAYPAGLADGPDSGWNCGTAGDDSTCVPNTTGSSCHDSCRKLGLCGRCGWSTCYDDVNFVDQLVDALQNEFCLDSTSYFLVGESNGGMLVHHLLQERPGKYLAAAPVYALPLLGYLVGSNFQLISRASHAQRTSLFALFPRFDTTIPWTGGRDRDNGWLYEPRNKTLGVWAALHNCATVATQVPVVNQYGGGEKNLECFTYAQCKSAGQVSYCMYDGAHGDWPDQPLADSMIWSFFTSMRSRAESGVTGGMSMI